MHGASLGFGGGLELGPVQIGVNLLDTKDFYVLGRDGAVLVAKLRTPLANGHHFLLEIAKRLGRQGRESLWWTYRFELARLLEW